MKTALAAGLAVLAILGFVFFRKNRSSEVPTLDLGTRSPKKR